MPDSLAAASDFKLTKTEQHGERRRCVPRDETGGLELHDDNSGTPCFDRASRGAIELSACN
jgi:hypothetical protein